MAEEKMKRLGVVVRQLNIGLDTALDFLHGSGHTIEKNPNTKISEDLVAILEKEFASSAQEKKEASELTIGKRQADFVIDSISDHTTAAEEAESSETRLENFSGGTGRVTFIRELPKEKETPAPVPQPKPKPEPKEEVVRAEAKLPGPKVVGKIELDKKPTKKPDTKPVTSEPLPTEIVAKPQVEEKEQPKVVATQKEEIVKTEAIAEPEPIEEIEEPKAEAEVEKPTPVKSDEIELVEGKSDTLKGLKVVGKIDLQQFKKPTPAAKPNKDKDSPEGGERPKKQRKRMRAAPIAVGSPDGTLLHRESLFGTKEIDKTTQPTNFNTGSTGGKDKKGDRKSFEKEEFSKKEISGQIKATMFKMAGKGGKKKIKDRKGNADDNNQVLEQNNKVLKVTEFISVGDLAALMDVSVNEVITTCMAAGMFVSINQRLDAEAITFIADEFGFETDFSTVEEEVMVEDTPDNPEDLVERAPIVTIMGHVDHGKTSLLDYIRKTKVAASEAGGITQHIGAYHVKTDSGRQITFLDTPGHEAFTAMRARGAKVTDVVIIVIAADDSVMPQTKEAINHAQVAGVPIVIAINKIDKPNANPDKIREELAQLNILVEEWGGKYQCQEISAKTGVGVSELLEKVLVEADLMELKANPNKRAQGTVIEASLDKGRGYVSTLLVQSGTLKVGDVLLVGAMYGRVKAMTDHVGKKINSAGPSIPVQVLGLSGAPAAGEKFSVFENERDAREIASKREQLMREQSLRTKKHITIDEIGRRIALGTFKELNIILKADFDGSVEALSDSLMKLSTEEIQVKIIHKAVGQISEADVMLASAADAIIIGFQVRPSANARKLAEQEQIEIKLYSIIYDAINEVKDAMEGLLAPKIEEVIVGNAEVREVFKISKVGNIAGCYVTEGYIKRNNQIRIIRDGIVIHTGNLEALKRFKDDVSEVKFGYECGMSFKNYNDIEVGDIIESFEQREVKRTL